MSNSIISNERYCYFCGTPYNLHKHHIFYGTANRQKSEKYGCWVYLCYMHHNGSNAGVHFNKKLDTELKQRAQCAFEAHYHCTRAAFVNIFGKNYLDDLPEWDNKKMTFIIWRKSVFDNNFKCNICGQKLIDDNGEPNARTIINEDFIQCRCCRNVVAEIERSIDDD